MSDSLGSLAALPTIIYELVSRFPRPDPRIAVVCGSKQEKESAWRSIDLAGGDRWVFREARGSMLHGALITWLSQDTSTVSSATWFDMVVVSSTVVRDDAYWLWYASYVVPRRSPDCELVAL